MTKEFSISARDHGFSIAQKGLDLVTGLRRLPCVAVETIDTEDDLGDFLLRRAGPVSVKGTQHSALAGAHLSRQPRVGGNGPAVQSREKAIHGFDPVEALNAERDRGNRRRVPVNGAVNDLERLPVRETEAKRRVVICQWRIASPWFGENA